MRRLLLGLSLCVLLAFPAGAQATSTPASIALYGASSQWSGIGETGLFDEANSTFSASADASWFHLDATGGGFAPAKHVFVRLVPPPGQQLAEGFYSSGLEIGGSEGACGVDRGAFEIKDIEVAPDGRVNRLWALFRLRCVFDFDEQFGEVRYGLPPAQPATALPHAVRWPDVEFGGTGRAVPVAIRATGASPVTVTSASLAGAAAGDFAVVDDRCSGEQLNPSERCEVSVRYLPRAAGSHSATLHVTGSDGLDVATELEGRTHGGVTRARVLSDPAALLGYGNQFSYDPSNARFVVTGDEHKVEFRVHGPSGDDWVAGFASPPGETLQAGRSYTGPIDIWLEGFGSYGTMRFDVSEAAFDSNGDVQHFGVGFIADGSESGWDYPAARGTFEYRVPLGTASMPEIEQAQPLSTRVQPAFAVRRIKVGRHGVSTHVIKVPRAGKLELVESAARGTVARVRRSLSHAGVYKVVLRPNRKGRVLLKKHHRLRVRVRTTFTPTGGHSRTSKIRLILRG